MSTHHLQSEETEEQCSFSMFNVIGQPRAEPIYTVLKVNGSDLKVEVDTGASVSVISRGTFHKLCSSGGAPELKETNIRLKTYTGECISLAGAIDVDIEYHGQRVKGTLLVAEGERPSLLGCDLLQKIRLDWGEIWREVKNITVVQDILAKYTDVFEDELGTLQGTSVKLCVDPKAQPRFFTPRSVPYAMRAKVEAELERLQQAGVIEPVEFSDWAAPIVPVVKEDGGVCICGDYKLTIN